MEVDPPPVEEGTISVHPLALVHMSDQYTRVTCGGSPLSPEAPVVGLLFGFSSSTPSNTLKNICLDIREADDIPIDSTQATHQQQVSLHQAVFPQHSVVGWYRVSSNPLVTPDDLRLTQRLQQHYAPQGQQRFVFSLLQVPEASTDTDMATTSPESSSMLPLTLYQLDDSSEQQPVLVALPHWDLETLDAERIALERVVREPPSSSFSKEEQPPSSYRTHLESLQESLGCARERLAVLVDWLEGVSENGSLEDYPHALLRQVASLLYELGPLVAHTPRQLQQANHEESLLSHLAVASQTLATLQAYTTKVDQVQGTHTTTRAVRAPRGGIDTTTRRF